MTEDNRSFSADEENRLVERLRREGVLGSRSRWRGSLRLVAAIALFAAGAASGAWVTSRATLEARLSQEALSADERSQLLRRAAEAYARATERFVESPEVNREFSPPPATRILWF